MAFSLGSLVINLTAKTASFVEGMTKAGRTFFLRFSVNGLTRGDFKTCYEGYAVGRQWGWLSANDVREQESMNPLSGDQGDIYLGAHEHDGRRDGEAAGAS